MTTQQIIWMTGGYSVALVAVVYFTRATARRVFGALVGGAVVGWLFVGVVVLGERMAWWHAPLPATPGLLALFYAGAAISVSPIYLITWRVARRFGWRGLAVCLAAAAIIGPPRDYLYAAVFPEWIVFAPGLAPVLADSATYFGLVAVGHAVMRLVAGPAQADGLGHRRIMRSLRN